MVSAIQQRCSHGGGAALGHARTSRWDPGGCRSRASAAWTPAQQAGRGLRGEEPPLASSNVAHWAGCSRALNELVTRKPGSSSPSHPIRDGGCGEGLIMAVHVCRSPMPPSERDLNSQSFPANGLRRCSARWMHPCAPVVVAFPRMCRARDRLAALAQRGPTRSSAADRGNACG